MPAGLVEQIAARVEAFDRTYSRFRDDSLVSAIARTPGTYPFPDDAPELFELYRRLYEATDAAVSPLVGRTLETLGYDRGYSRAYGSRYDRGGYGGYGRGDDFSCTARGNGRITDFRL